MPAKRPSYAQAAGSLPLRAPFNRSPILDKKWPAYFRPSAGFYPPDAVRLLLCAFQQSSYVMCLSSQSSSPTEAVTNRCVIPIVGLRNTGNTCYINVALQIINFTPEMHEAIEVVYQYISTMCLLCAPLFACSLTIALCVEVACAAACARSSCSRVVVAMATSSIHAPQSMSSAHAAPTTSADCRERPAKSSSASARRCWRIATSICSRPFEAVASTA